MTIHGKFFQPASWHDDLDEICAARCAIENVNLTLFTNDVARTDGQFGIRRREVFRLERKLPCGVCRIASASSTEGA